MKTIIVIFKAEFAGKEHVVESIKPLAEEIKEVGDAHVFVPGGGSLMEFLSILRNHRIAYGTHFNTSNPSINESGTTIL